MTTLWTYLRLSIPALMLVMLLPNLAAATSVLGKWQCQTVVNGAAINGTYQLEDWRAYHNTLRHYGYFRSANGAVWEFEVFAGQGGGVGGLWMNGMRHRETHIQLSVGGGGFVLHTEDGAIVNARCA